MQKENRMSTARRTDAARDDAITHGPVRHRAAAFVARMRDDEGAATAEYAIATMAAVGFAGLLVVIMRSDEVRTILTDLVRRALTFNG
jgi:Flp pilus assembly pilin Flp